MTDTSHNRSTRTDISNLASVVNGDILRSAAIIALVVGSFLTLANQSAAIFGDEELEYLPLVLVYLTPLVVVMISQMLGIWRATMDARQNGGHRWGEEPVLATAISHGIPLRAVLVGVLVGSINASIVIAIALLEGAGANSLPVAVLAQAYVLPLLFGVLTQTIAYRRASQAFRFRA